MFFTVGLTKLKTARSQNLNGSAKIAKLIKLQNFNFLKTPNKNNFAKQNKEKEGLKKNSNPAKFAFVLQLRDVTHLHCQ